MNNLQKPTAKLEYLVSINPFDKIDESKIIRKMDYEHPNFTVENYKIQNKLPELNINTKIFFA
jgi:predicted NAD/FAD-binding protein